MKRILIGYVTNLKTSGINKYLMNVIESLKEEDIQIDFLTRDYSKQLEEEMHRYNIGLKPISRLSSPIKCYMQTKRIVKNGNYDIIYFNISEAFDCICNIAAKKNSNSIIITHSHNAGNDSENFIERQIKMFLHKICKKIVRDHSDYYFACSKLAGKWIFGNRVIQSDKFRVIRNTIDTKKFKYNIEARKAIRDQFQIEENDYVIGFVGHFVYQKNPLFLIDIFNEVLKLNDKCKLLLVGKGEMEFQMMDIARTYNIEKHIIFTGPVNNVYDYMSAMDSFLFPSRFEGLGIVGIEAQINGLQCYFSTALPEEVEISNLANFISLNNSAEYWAKIINNNLFLGRRNDIKYKNVCVDCNKQKKEFQEIFIRNQF